MIILHVDDEESERLLFARAVGSVTSEVGVVSAESAERAVELLRGMARSGRSNEVIVVTDLKMPGVDGLELLRTIRGDVAFESVPVIVLSTSSHGPDVRASYRAGCAAYHEKPLGLRASKEFTASLVAYWSSAMLAPMAPWPAGQI